MERRADPRRLTSSVRAGVRSARQTDLTHAWAPLHATMPQRRSPIPGCALTLRRRPFPAGEEQVPGPDQHRRQRVGVGIGIGIGIGRDAAKLARW